MSHDAYALTPARDTRRQGQRNAEAQPERQPAEGSSPVAPQANAVRTGRCPQDAQRCGFLPGGGGPALHSGLVMGVGQVQRQLRLRAGDTGPLQNHGTEGSPRAQPVLLCILPRSQFAVQAGYHQHKLSALPIF